MNWARKQEMAYVVAEYGESDKRHLHGVVLLKENYLRDKLKGNIWDRYVKPHHPDSIRNVAVKVQVCPGNDWYNTYLKKETGVEVLLDDYCPEAALAYFPSQAVQEALMATKKCTGMACPHLEHDTTTWAGSPFENSPEGALCYLKNRMFVEKNMVPIADPRKLTEKAHMYWQYRNGINTPTERELFLLKQLRDGPAYDVPSIRGVESAARPSI